MSDQVGQIKRFILRALLKLEGAPMPGEALDQAVKETLAPRPLQSDIELARRDLEEKKFILGTKDELDGNVSWSLTTKGELKAKQL